MNFIGTLFHSRCSDDVKDLYGKV